MFLSKDNLDRLESISEEQLPLQALKALCSQGHPLPNIEDSTSMTETLQRFDEQDKLPEVPDNQV